MPSRRLSCCRRATHRSGHGRKIFLGVLVTAVDVADCTGPTRLILAGAPVGTTGTLYLKLVDADGKFSVWDQELTPHAA